MPELAEDTLLDVDAGTSGEGGNSDLSGDQGTQAPFLEVDERTKYATKEEALKGYKEAGQRIAELSRWEKELEPFGVKDPRVTAELLRELSQLRREQSARTAAAPKAVDAKPSTPAEKLSEEETKARAWLRTAVTDPDLKSALIEQLGLKGATEQIAELKKQLETLSEGYKTDGETRTQSLVEDGESKIGSWLKEGGLDAGKYKFVASVVKNFLEADQDRVDRFFRGGASLDKVVREGYDWALSELGWKAAAADASSAQNKGKAIAANKTLPAGGAATKGTDGPKPKQTSGLPDHISKLSDKAWDTFQKNLK